MRCGNFWRGICGLGILLVMGFTMPNCPGSRTLMSEIEVMKSNREQDLRRVQNLENKINLLTQDFAAAKQSLGSSGGELARIRESLVSLEKRLEASAQRNNKRAVDIKKKAAGKKRSR